MPCETSQYLDEAMAFGTLHSKECGDENIPLASVHMNGEVRGLLFSLTILQTFVNLDTRPHEVIYTFPLAWHTALLGIAATIGEKRLIGAVFEKKQAEEKYEKALSEGDGALLVQQSAKGLCTVNLGNIKACETICIEIRCARLLRFEGKRVRLCIPTVISERYGDEHMPLGLAPHETAVASPKASYPFTLAIRLYGEIAKGRISCPSHAIEAKSLEGSESGLVFSLAQNAFLDRDFVLLCDELQSRSIAGYCRVRDETMIVASFAPRIAESSSPIAVKILADCSGSMQGSRIAEAKKGLEQVLQALTPNDMVSFSRFGSKVQRETQEAVRATEDNISRLKELVKKTEASLGGTETEGALRDTFQIRTPEDIVPSLLLITDGDIWNVEGVIALARQSGQRIFAVGVGSAPAESLLREMALETGGACEFVTESEDIREAIIRIVGKMRTNVARNVCVRWNYETTWQSKLPKYLYDGETIHCVAITQAQTPVAVPVLHFETDKSHEAAADSLERVDSTDLFRLGKLRQMLETESKAEQKAIALENQLLCEQTSLFLRIERALEDKVTELASVCHVPQMVASGHGCHTHALSRSVFFCNDGYSDGCPADTEDVLFDSYPSPPVSAKKARAKANRGSTQGAMAKHPPKDSASSFNALRKNLIDIWLKNLPQMQAVTACLNALQTKKVYADFYKKLREISVETKLSEEQILCFLMLRILNSADNNWERHSERLITAYLTSVSEEQRECAQEKVNALLKAIERS
ncbi:MAG: VWA domain-containing protein [Desulfovibrionaceae bacterium]|nr:VWA domain-containing protein [Desulfovibrionaceae bacterium]